MKTRAARQLEAATREVDAAADAALAGARLEDLSKTQLVELRAALEAGALEVVTARVKTRLIAAVDRRLGRGRGRRW
jgi:hypothetical protein